MNRVRLSATTNACRLINVTFKRQKSPKLTADGRIHEEIRGQADVFSINFDLYDWASQFFLSQYVFNIFCITVQIYQQTIFNLETCYFCLFLCLKCFIYDKHGVCLFLASFRKLWSFYDQHSFCTYFTDISTIVFICLKCFSV